MPPGQRAPLAGSKRTQMRHCSKHLGRRPFHVPTFYAHTHTGELALLPGLPLLLLQFPLVVTCCGFIHRWCMGDILNRTLSPVFFPFLRCARQRIRPQILPCDTTYRVFKLLCSTLHVGVDSTQSQPVELADAGISC